MGQKGLVRAFLYKKMLKSGTDPAILLHTDMNRNLSSGHVSSHFGGWIFYALRGISFNILCDFLWSLFVPCFGPVAE